MTFYNIAQVIINIEKFKENPEDTRVFHNTHPWRYNTSSSRLYVMSHMNVLLLNQEPKREYPKRATARF